MARRSKTSVSDATKARQAKSKELAKKYQHEASELKRKGVLSSRVNARKNITRATRTKINKFRDVLEGKAIAVRAPKQSREAYRAAGVLAPDRFTERGAFLVVPKTFGTERASLRKGKLTPRVKELMGGNDHFLSVVRPLKNGEEETIWLSVPPEKFDDLAQELITNPSLDNLKNADELFSFRLNGHNARESFVNAKEMGEYLLRYVRDNVVTLTFQRFKLPKNATDLRNPNEGPDSDKLHTKGLEPRGSGRFGRVDSRGRNTGRAKRERRNKKTEAERKAAYRAKLSDEKKAAIKKADAERHKRRYWDID